MYISLSFNNFEKTLILPVLPSEITVSTGLKNNTFDVISMGEIGVIGNNKLKTITISSFFPKHYSSYCVQSTIPDPYTAVADIETWRDSKRPIRLIITETPIAMPCMIEEFNYREKGGQPGDVYYDLSLKEYKFIQVKQIATDASADGNKVNTANTRPDERQLPDSYTVKKGDSLYTIAKRFYGDGERYREVHNKNRDKIGPDPDLIYPGQVLQL